MQRLHKVADNKRIREANKSIEALLGQSHTIDPITQEVPVIPFANRYRNYELGALFQHMLVYRNNWLPDNRQPFTLGQIGRDLKPNYSLIKKRNEILKIHKVDINDYYDYYGISPELREYLLDFGSQFSAPFKNKIFQALQNVGWVERFLRNPTTVRKDCGFIQ